MPSTNDNPRTLTDLRVKAGYTQEQAAQKAGLIDSNFPATRVGMRDIEIRGTRDYWKLLVLSQIYDMPLHAIALIALPKNAQNKNSQMLQNVLTTM